MIKEQAGLRDAGRLFQKKIMREEKIKDLISRMTLKEKLCQLTQVNAAYLINSSAQLTGENNFLNLTREEFGMIGSVLNFADAEEMKRIQDEHFQSDRNKIPVIFMMDVIHGYRTIFPIPLAIGCSFDFELAKECAHMSASEAFGEGVNVTFSPMVDLVRDPRWGRVMESTSEDVWLNCRFAEAFVQGYHLQKGFGCCVKHFAAYGAPEAGREYNAVDMSEHSLYEYYFPAYKAAIDSGCEMVMVAFNTLNGIPATGNRWLLSDVLRKEFSFTGVVITDYNAVREMITHGFAEDDFDCSEKAMDASVDMEMMSPTFIQNGEKLVEQRIIQESDIDEKVYRVLLLKNKLGLFEAPYGGAFSGEGKAESVQAYREIARRAAIKSCVLLKNNEVLPLSKKLKIALVGPFADTGDILGYWHCRGDATETVTLFEGLKKLAGSFLIGCAEGCGLLPDATDESGFSEAIELSQKSDVIVFAFGEAQELSGEGGSSAHLQIPYIQSKLLKELKRAGKPIVGIVFTGRPLALTDVVGDLDALICAWFPGTEGGNALAQLIFGKENFEGRLSMSFPRCAGQCPIHYDSFRTGRPKPRDVDGLSRFCSAYRDEKNLPLFPFGFGLSYSNFLLSDVELSAKTLYRGGEIAVSAQIINNGDYTGVATVQMYIHDVTASVVRPVKQLKGIQKILLRPGERKKACFTISTEILSYYGQNNAKVLENGKFEVTIGFDSVSGETEEFFLVESARAF